MTSENETVMSARHERLGLRKNAPYSVCHRPSVPTTSVLALTINTRSSSTAVWQVIYYDGQRQIEGALQVTAPRELRLTTTHSQIGWDNRLEQELTELVRLAIHEDLDGGSDWTTVSLVPDSAVGKAFVVAREPGVAVGMRVGASVFKQLHSDATWRPTVSDGAAIESGATLAVLEGKARDLLTAERTILNIVGRLSGVATLTDRYVSEVEGTNAAVCDTRKTTPAWRHLEKFAVRCGGGLNHRTGLYDAILIKDNHLAFCDGQATAVSPADAVRRAREFIDRCDAISDKSRFIIEIEVDSIDQLENVLPSQPDIVLLDNMSTDQLTAAIRLRDQVAPSVALEASGGVTLQTIGAIAKTGVERISVGALTHSAPNFDVGLDWY